MPKDWKYHKAEVERLYIKEGKPLEQIRDILREEHGFNASMRAYRMRIDNWGLDQNKYSKGSLQSRRKSPQLSISTGPISQSESTTPLDGLSTGDDLRPPTQQNTPSPIRKERGPFDVISAFQTLLAKWQPRTESALLCFQHPDFDEWAKKSNDSNGPILFKLIEALVPQEEQFLLYKRFLEADLLSQSDHDYPFTAWRCAWNLILRCDDLEEDDDECEVTYCSEDWERAKELLREDGVISQVAGQAFLDCALVVVAERRLEICKRDPHHWNRRKYLDILKDFRHSDIDVDPSFYKHSLQIIEVEELENSQQSLRKRADLADEYRHKYLQLMNHYAFMKRRVGQAAGIPLDASTPSQAQAAAEQYPSPDTATICPSANGNPECAPVATTREVFELLVNKWKTLNDFTEYAHSIITSDGWAISIFEPSPVGGDNLFDIIQADTPPAERVPLVTALLVAFSSINLTRFYSPWFLHWWTSVYASPSWEKFQARLDLPRITAHLERIMSTDAAKTFIDSVTMLVGERILLGIKTRLVDSRRKCMNDAEKEVFKRLQKQYMGILRAFYDRDMKVDQTWTYYLMNVI
ncbi:hypothetical protein ONS96_005347 [Cadophora gregata f. sp. sojae]|nr:hypothetical protein ONS96_005347 [Cadophora gregata f. sp. sojae]